MIQSIEENDKHIILELLSKDIYQNPYLYIDTISFGFTSDKVNTWKIVEDGQIIGVIYKYDNSLQIFVESSLSDTSFEDVASFVKEGKFEMATGKADVINRLQELLKGHYNSNFGYILSFDKRVQDQANEHLQLATIDDLEESASLICTDENIGGHYTVEQLTEQFKERMQHNGCINVIYKEGNRIASHAATYADLDDFAIIGGIITDSSYRGKGLARLTTLKLAYILQNQNKVPLIFCYDPQLIEWYKSIGFETRTNCGKLERIR